MPVTFIRKSTLTGKTHSRTLPLTSDELYRGLELHSAGLLIQDIFPQLSADDREFLISGITPEEWDETFKPEDEE